MSGYNPNDNGKKPAEEEYTTRSAINTNNEIMDVLMRKCPHCIEIIPVVNTCSSCGTPYEHINTVENPDTGFIHFVYECSGCPPEKRKAQKIIKINENGNGRQPRDDLIKNFL